MKPKFIFIFFFVASSLFSYQSETYLKAFIIGKVAKYVEWSAQETKDFTIAVLHNPFENILDTIYKNKMIHGKKVKLVYINDISELPEDTNILYIPKEDSAQLPDIIDKIKDKPILTISPIRGFAEKKGILQIYFVARKIKFKINLDIAKQNDLYIKSTLLRISKVLQKDKL